MDLISWWPNERMQTHEALAATPAALDIRRKASAKLPTPHALPLIALVSLGKGHLPGYTCPLRASGGARCMTLAPQQRLASDRDYNAPRTTEPTMVARAPVDGMLE